jgi:hypothetical protein
MGHQETSRLCFGLCYDAKAAKVALFRDEMRAIFNTTGIVVGCSLRFAQTAVTAAMADQHRISSCRITPRS